MEQKRYIVRVDGAPEPARPARKIIRMLDYGELSPTDEVYDMAAFNWRPLTEVEPFKSHLEREGELGSLTPEEFAKRKQIRQPGRYVLMGVGILVGITLIAFGVATIFNMFAEGIGGIPEVQKGRAELLWKFRVGDSMTSSPYCSGGRVYFGAEDGYLYCVDAGNGHGLWKHRTGGPIIGEVLVADGRVYVGSCDDALWCFDALTGKRLWRFGTGHYVGGGVTCADGRVYFGSYDHHAYCLDAVTGEEVWRFETDAWVFSTPFVAGGRVYFGSLDGRLYCLRAETGEPLWSFETGGEVYSSPYVYEGRVYFGSDDTWLRCLDAETGDVFWRYRDPDYWHYIRSRIVVFDGRVYFGCLNHIVYCVDAADGKELWRHKTTNTVEAGGVVVGELTDGREFWVSQPARWIEGGEWPLTLNLSPEGRGEEEAAEAYLLIGSANGSLYCLDAWEGKVVWAFAAKEHVVSDPAYGDGVAYFASDDGYLYAVRSHTDGEG
jgi:outer membrane protein assembly factor BamB